MNPLLIEDIFVQICCKINHTKTLIIIEEVSNWHKKIIRINKWFNLSVCIKNEEKLISMLSTHIFCNLNLRDTNVTDERVSKLVYVHTLNLRGTKVTDKSVSKLVNLHTLNLRNTNVTDESVSKLVNLHTLNL